MAKISIENGVYTNLDNAYPSGKTGLGAQRIANGGNPVNDLENGDIATKLVNAIEIDWNGAQVQLSGENSSRTINTTGELMNLIKEVSSPMLAN